MARACFTALASSCSLTGSERARPTSASSACSTASGVWPLRTVQAIEYRYGSTVGLSPADTLAARPVSTSARYSRDDLLLVPEPKKLKLLAPPRIESSATNG